MILLAVLYMMMYILFLYLTTKFLMLEVNPNPARRRPISVFFVGASRDLALLSRTAVCGACRLVPRTQEVALEPVQAPGYCYLCG